MPDSPYVYAYSIPCIIITSPVDPFTFFGSLVRSCTSPGPGRGAPTTRIAANGK
jgi:hypothetical protein